jgi:hypothetical protein
LVEALNREFGFSGLRTPALSWLKHDNDDKPGKRPVPVPVPAVKLMDFSPESHPFITDMRLFLDSQAPAFDAAAIKEGRFKPLPGLSYNDPGYLEFMLEACVRLKLVKLTPSINNEIGLVNGSYERFFDNRGEVILRRAVDAAADLTTQRLTEILPIKKTFKSSLISYIRKPKPIDKIFDDMFYDSGIDILKFFEDMDRKNDFLNVMMDMALEGADFKEIEDQLENTPGTGLEDLEINMQAEIMTGAFFLGVELDKCFLTPLGFYLRIIQPVYILPFNVEEELEGIGDMAKGMDEPSPLIYAPCSEYTLTDLGRLVMDVTEAPRERQDNGVPEGPALIKLVNSLEDMIEAAGAQPFSSAKTSTVLTLKLQSASDTRLWLNAELPPDLTLESMHVFINRVFLRPAVNDYSFFAGGHENPFGEYKPGGPPARRTDKVSIGDMNLSQGDELLYRTYTVDNIRKTRRKGFSVNIRVLSVTEKSGNIYPRVSRRSKALTESIRG